MDSIPWEKAQLAAEEKPHCVLGKKPYGQRFKEHRAARWMERIKRIERIISFLLREHATVFY